MSKDNPDRSDRFHPIRYASERIGMSESWIYKHHEDLPFVVRIGGRLKVSELELKKWMKKRGGGGEEP